MSVSASSAPAQPQPPSKTWTTLDKVVLAGGLLAARHLECHGGGVDRTLMLLSCTTGGAIMGLLDSENSRATKIVAYSAVVGISAVLIPHVSQRYSCEGDGLTLIAAAVVAAGVYHFASDYLKEFSPWSLNDQKKGK